MLVVAAAAVVVVVLLVLVLVVRPGVRRPVSGPVPTPTARPSATGAAFGVRDEREVTFEELTVALPGTPYSCQDPLPTPPPGFDGYVSCDAVVHDNFDGLGNTWESQVGVVLLDGSLGHPDDLDTSAKDAFRYFYRAFYSADDSPTRSDEVGEPVTVHGPAGAAYRHRVRVRVDREGLHTTSDLLSVEVVRLRSGRVAAVYADLPNDAQREVLRAVLVSQASITLH